MRTLLLVALSLLITLNMTAQQTVEQQTEELKKALSTPIVDWDPAFIQTNFQKFVDLYINKLLWDPDFQKRMKNNLPRIPPHVFVRVTGELRTPYAENNQIILPVEYIGYLGNISTLVGHDLYGSDNYVHLERPLLSTPFRTSAIIPLLNPLYRFVDTNGYQTIQYYLRCPPADRKCAEVQESSINALILFALLHEISHQFFHHDLAYEGVSLDKELAADQNAYLVLTRLTSDFSDPDGDKDTTKEIRLAYRLSPIVWLEIEESKGGLANVVAKARKEALIEKLTHEEHEQIDELLQPETSSDNLARLSITWKEDPDLLFIDGLSVPINDIKGKALLVTSGAHTVVAFLSNAVAINRFSIHSDEQVPLVFQPFGPIDVTAAMELEKKADWEGVLYRTTDEHLLPRDPTLAVYHWEALHHLGLDSLISIEDWTSIPNTKRKTYLHWENSGKPLSSWHAGLAPGSSQ